MVTVDNKDVDRAKSCQSGAKAAAQASAIKDSEKLKRRAKAFIDEYGIEDEISIPFVRRIESIYKDKQLSDEDFESIIGTDPKTYFQSQQPESIKKLNEYLRRIAELKVKNAKLEGQGIYNKYTKQIDALVDEFKGWLGSANARQWIALPKPIYDPYFVKSFRDKGQKYITGEVIPIGQLAKDLDARKKLVSKVMKHLRMLSVLNSIVKPADRGVLPEYTECFRIDLSSQSYNDIEELAKKYNGLYPNTIIVKSSCIEICPAMLDTVDALPEVPNYWNSSSKRESFDKLATDEDKVKWLLSNIHSDINIQADNFEKVVNDIIKDCSKLLGVGKKMPSKNWIFKSVPELERGDLKNFPGLIYIDNDNKKVIPLRVDEFGKRAGVSTGRGYIYVGDNKISFDSLMEHCKNDYVINPFYVERANLSKITTFIKNISNVANASWLCKPANIKIVIDVAKQLVVEYREAGILKSYSEVVYNINDKSFSVITTNKFSFDEGILGSGRSFSE